MAILGHFARQFTFIIPLYMWMPHTSRFRERFLGGLLDLGHQSDRSGIKRGSWALERAKNQTIGPGLAHFIGVIWVGLVAKKQIKARGIICKEANKCSG